MTQRITNQGINTQNVQTPEKQKIDRQSLNFQDLFNQELNKSKQKLSLSAHAESRLESRNIELDETDMENLNNTVDELDKKGAKSSLIIYKDSLFVTSVPNRTIVTAMDQSEENLKIITNIDSAAVLS
jgi:flagellar operon protein